MVRTRKTQNWPVFWFLITLPGATAIGRFRRMEPVRN